MRGNECLAAQVLLALAAAPRSSTSGPQKESGKVQAKREQDPFPGVPGFPTVSLSPIRRDVVSALRPANIVNTTNPAP